MGIVASVIALAIASAATLTPMPATAVKAPADHSSMAGMNHGDMAAPKVPTLLDGYGAGGFPITTRVPYAQAFFTNGMQLAHAFAHKASVEAMKEAVRLDPQCAMCLWGLAWADGPTINYGKEPAEIAVLAKQADDAADIAEKDGTDRERSLTKALQLRYADGRGRERGESDLNFAKAMTSLAGEYPEDKTLAVLAADAWIQAPGESRQVGVLNAHLAMRMLEPVLARDPDYTPAIHFYIHATELAGEPGKAERFADRLAPLAPHASHLVHMPSHTYYWVGRYQDAADTNMRAVGIDVDNARRLKLGPPDGVWGLPYHAHNVTFGLGGALMSGDSKTALALGRPLVARAGASEKAPAFMQLLSALGYDAVGLYAPTAEVLALPQPKTPFVEAAWHYARGEAFARNGDAAGVRREAGAIHGGPGKIAKDDGSLAAQQMTFIARNVLQGRAAMMERRFADAAAFFRQGAELQENSDFTAIADPPAWYYPVRRDLAAALLANGDQAGARREAEAALKYRAKDPGSLALLDRLGTRIVGK